MHKDQWMMVSAVAVVLAATLTGCQTTQQVRSEAVGLGVATYLLAASGAEGRLTAEIDVDPRVELVEGVRTGGRAQIRADVEIDQARMQPTDATTMRALLALLGDEAPRESAADDASVDPNALPTPSDQ